MVDIGILPVGIGNTLPLCFSENVVMGMEKMENRERITVCIKASRNEQVVSSILTVGLLLFLFDLS
jgi:hypothetical protein